jgi:hypothetical protein
MTQSINVGRLNFRRENGTVTVRWLGHGTTVPSDPAHRAPTLDERRALALHLLAGYQWVRAQ